ncbi:NTTRR-F1 domain [Bacillus carboniphilus]|uniref:NTTRR-F1 domain n=1 Tax=Bacillus carboniphilus TaxID=86663 RepID=A0ABY9JV36_9BACI|nr:NTTRR-F1 domain [Bacillus carboniphilus]WLR43255.1 NTTRR-F1 domain [Bacillus carboniphilus]
MAITQDLIQNGNFKSGTLDPWIGENADVIASPCPSIVDDFSARLKGGEEVATLFQNFNVITGETYQLVLSIATARKGTSPPVKIRVEFLNRLLEVVGIGLDESISQSQLPNGADGKFNTIQLLTAVVPKEARFARLIIEKQGLAFSPGVVIDNVLMSRITAELTPLPNTYVGNTSTDTTSIIFEDTFNTLTVGNTPNAMIRAFSDETKLLYIAFGNEEYVSVIDVSTHTEMTTISVMGTTDYYFNRNIAVSPDGSKVYIASNQSDNGFVNVVDTSTNQLVGVVTVGGNPTAVLISNNGSNVYVGSVGSTSVVQIDTDNLIITETFTLNSNYRYTLFLAITSSDQQLIVGTEGDLSNQCNGDKDLPGRFSIFDVSTGERIIENTLAECEIMYSMSISTDEMFLYVGTTLASNGSTLLRVYDTMQFKEITCLQLVKGGANFPKPNVIASISEGEGEEIIFVSGIDIVIGFIFFTNIYEVSRCNDSFTTITNICIDGFTNGFFTVSSDGSSIITANQSDNTISFFDTDSFTLNTTLDVGAGPEVLVVD